MKTVGFKVENVLKQRDALAPKLCNVALEYVITDKSTALYKSLELIGYAGDINITGRRKRTVSEELKKSGKEVGLNIKVKKKKQEPWYKIGQEEQTKYWQLKDHNIEVVKRFKYLGTVISDTSDDTEEFKARILAANKAYSSLQSVFRFKQIHWNNVNKIIQNIN